MKKYLVVFLKDSDYFIEVKRSGTLEPVFIEYKYEQNKIVEANSKEEVLNEFQFDIILNIIELGN